MQRAAICCSMETLRKRPNSDYYIMTHVVVAEVKYFDVGCPRCECLESVQRPQLVVAQLNRLQLWYVIPDYLYYLQRKIFQLPPIKRLHIMG